MHHDEEAVVAAILQGASFDEARRVLKPSMFTHRPALLIFRAAAGLDTAGTKIDTGTIAHALGEDLDAVGGHAYLTQLVREANDSMPLYFYAGEVRKAYGRREIGRIGLLAQELAIKADVAVDDALDQIEGQLLNVRAGTGTRQTTRWAGELLESVAQTIEEHLQDPKAILGQIG